MSDTDTPRRRRRRRPGTTPRFDTTVPSPCIGVCWLDEQTGLCDGCLRTGEEIRDWIIMDRAQKLAVLAQLAQRRLLRDQNA
ncbi:MAG: DUF1289 domain-containing protein [Thiothrix sp.]|nr:DUF1289 domain-containing protein [Thiothrix sp.]HPE59531.1 DUF1289 domain-containing protein [Thiolinea sp.]